MTIVFCCSCREENDVEDVVVGDVEDEEDEAEEEERENPTVLRHRQFHREIFRPYDSLLNLLRSSSEIVGGEGKLSARIHIHVALPCYIERYAKAATCPSKSMSMSPLLETQSLS